MTATDKIRLDLVQAVLAAATDDDGKINPETVVELMQEILVELWADRIVPSSSM